MTGWGYNHKFIGERPGGRSSTYNWADKAAPSKRAWKALRHFLKPAIGVPVSFPSGH
jgi:hypothetical protein